MTSHWRAWIVLVVLAALLGSADRVVVAQAGDVEHGPGLAALKSRLEATWRPVPLQHGVLLVPRRASVRVKGVEISDGGIAVDGRAVTGEELVERLGPDAEAVLQLSYLDRVQRDALFTDAGAMPVEKSRGTPEAIAAAPHEEFPRRVGRGIRVRVFGPVTVSEGEQVDDVVAVFGSVDLRGSARGDVVAVMGDVVMGPNASVGGHIVAVGGVLRGAAESAVAGRLTEVRLGWPELRFTVPGDDHVSVQVTPDWPRIARVLWVSGVVGATILIAICAFTVMVAPGAVTASGGPGRSLIASGLVGLGVELLLLPAILLIASALTLSVVGIPLLAGIPILLLFVAAAAVVGFTAVAGRLGGLWRWGGRAAPLANVVSGLVLILATGLTGRYMWAASGGDSTLGALLALVGLAIEYACWTIGLGSATLALVSRRARRMPATAAVVPPPIAADAS